MLLTVQTAPERVFPILSEAVEIILPTITTIIKELLPSLLSILESLMPIVDSVLTVLSPIMDIVSALIGPISMLIGCIAPLIDLLYSLKEVIIVVTSALLAYKAALLITSAITTVINVVKSLITTMRILSTTINGATVAQLALNAAMSLNPVGVVVAAITALVAGIALLTNSLTNCSKEVKAMADEQERLKTSIDETIKNGEAETAILKMKAERYEELRNKISLTVEEETELRNLADEMQNVLGDEVEVIDKLTGKYADLTDEVSRYIEKKNQEIKLSAYEQAAKDAYLSMYNTDKLIEEKNAEMRKIESEGINKSHKHNHKAGKSLFYSSVFCRGEREFGCHQ